MSKKFNIITGASSGMGLALCKELIKNKNDCIGLSRTQPAIYDPHFSWIECDLSSKQSITNAISQFPKNCSIQSIVNNAGTLEPMGLFKNATAMQIENHFQIDLIAPLILIQALLNKFDSHSIGHIINISSGAASSVYPGWAAYCSSKAGLDQFTRVMAEEVPSHIEVLGFRPGVVDTPMQDAIRAMDEKEFPKRNKFVELKESGKLLAPEYPARILAWLVSRAETNFNGQIIDIRDEEFLKLVPRELL